jgi:hypothetical protein
MFLSEASSDQSRRDPKCADLFLTIDHRWISQPPTRRPIVDGVSGSLGFVESPIASPHLIKQLHPEDGTRKL